MKAECSVFLVDFLEGLPSAGTFLTASGSFSLVCCRSHRPYLETIWSLGEWERNLWRW